MRRKWIVVAVVAIIVVYALGPHPATPFYKKQLPQVPSDATALEDYISEREASHKLKPDNKARIIWNDSTKHKTDYALVYLPGFTASHAEGEPVHRNIAHAFGCNLYLPRLAEHGIDTTDALVNLTVDKYWESAEEALAIGRQIGKKVILMGTSTGGTFSLMLAAKYPEVHALILLSPNIAINDPFAFLLNSRWGLQIAQTVLQSDYIQSIDKREIYKQYWSTPYRVEAAVQLEELLETSMIPQTFKKVKQPVLSLYYYKNKSEQDNVVSVAAIKKMMVQLGTPAQLKRSIAVPEAGHHVLASYIKSKAVAVVQREIERFMTEVLSIKPVK
jgi:esterase/lipase